jgi:hypothetical protein
MTNTRFHIGQIVTANTNAQGLTKGNEYKIVNVVTQESAFWEYVQYVLAGTADECKDGLLVINNGHVLLNEATA